MSAFYVDGSGNRSHKASCPQSLAIDAWRPGLLKDHDKDAGTRTPFGLRCSICAQQVHTNLPQHPIDIDSYHGELTDRDAKLLAKDLTDTILADQDYLRGFLPRNCKTLLRRWMKGKQASKGYLKCIESLPKAEFPLITAATEDKTLAQLFEMRTSFLLPYFAENNLVNNPRSLLKLLHQRTTTTAAAWVSHDNNLIQYPWKQKCFKESMASGCVVLREGNSFGKWQIFDGHLVHGGEAYCTPRALLILEAQQTLFRMLRCIVTHMIPIVLPANVDHVLIDSPQDTDLSPTGISGLIELIDADKDGKVDIETISYARPSAEEPFSAPHPINIEFIIDLLRNQATAIQDELWLLQTDLPYFCADVQARSSHHFSDRKDFCKKGWDPMIKQHTIADDITSRVMDRYNEIKYQTEEALHIFAQYKGMSGCPYCRGTNPKCGCFRNPLAGLRRLCALGLGNYMADLQQVVEQNISFAQQYRDVSRPALGSHSFYVKLKLKPQQLFRKDPLLWCLEALFSRYPAHTHGISQASTPDDAIPVMVILQYLDAHLGKSKRKEVERISADIDSTLSLISAAARILHALDRFRPWILPFQEHLIDTGRAS